MNALKLSFPEIERQRNLNNVRPLYPSHHDYENGKRELQRKNFSYREYEIAIQMLVDELGL